MSLNERSRKNLVGVHPDLVRVVEMASERCPVPIVVTEGLRTLERQKELVAAGKSWTLNGRHLTGHAVDLVDADNYGYDIPDLDKIAKAMKECAAECGVLIVWGGDWKSRDTPHFELDRKAYPARGVPVATQAADVAKRTMQQAAVPVTAGGSVVTAISQGVPGVPEVASKSVENVQAWRGIAKTAGEVASEAAGLVSGLGRAWPYVAVAAVAGGVLAFLKLRRQ